MFLKTVRFFTIIFTILAFAPSMAHLLELQNKLKLTPENYMTVQNIYRGWDMLGIVVAGALISNFVLTILTRKTPKIFVYNLIALLSVAGALIIFFVFTYPANQATSNWTILPVNFIELRNQWEYSHAVGAGLYLIAVVSLVLSFLTNSND
jgi:hypothetical protein